MNDAWKRHPDWTVEVAPAAPDWAWSVTRGDQRVMSGQAPSPVSAQHFGAFASAAAQALERVGRRRF